MSDNIIDQISNTDDLANKMPGGAFGCNATGARDIFFINERAVEILGFDSTESFMEYVGGTVNGFISRVQKDYTINDSKLQPEKRSDPSGFTFFNFIQPQGSVIRIACYWRREKNPETGDKIYGMIFRHDSNNANEDIDMVTGMFGRKKLNYYIEAILEKSLGSTRKFTIVYLNIVNFKLLNIENGTSEGDKCLKILSDILIKNFSESYLARLSDDHFAIFGIYDDIVEKAEKSEAEFKDVYGKFYNVFVKFGIYKFFSTSDFDVEVALSRAKIACDYIKRDNSSNVVEYSDEIEEIIKIRDYLVRKLDEAIEKEWIKVYFQPVIRTLTGSLCSMESLVRWIDPEIGFLSPNRFITILENERIIHKLDSYVVDRVCRYIRERVNVGLPIVPVSVNFSQMDFMMCDMVQVVEDAVEKYDIPRDYIHIEITESMIASDEAMMHQIIGRFKQAGYEIWMDDFGSGYSSLTVLKDYSFDTLKMDMRFLIPFTERSMSIIRSVVTMAKRIGMKTLAEGVETKEQLDFLKKIGCGMIQGYYYGKPEPIEAVFEHIFEKNINIETRKWRHFYEIAGFNAVHTAFPLEIIEDDGKNFKTLFMNDAYRKQIFNETLSLEEIDRRIYHTASPLVEKYREFALRLEESGEEETFYYTSNGSYLKFTGQAIAECEGHYIIKGSMVNVSMDQNRNDTERLESKARQLNLLFETVMIVNINADTVVPLFGGFKYIRAASSKVSDLQKCIKFIENEVVHPTEKIRCHEFLLSSSLKDRVERTGRGYISEIFRVIQSNGNYQWKEFFIMMVPGTGASEYLYCMKDYTSNESLRYSEDGERSDSELSGSIKNSFGYNIINIWKSLMWNSNIKFFWKDMDLRFRGVSKAFLEYFGYENDKEVIGKSAEELKWNLDNDAFRVEEEEIINKGKKVLNQSGHFIVKDKIRNIIYDKIPVYNEDKIIGLVGNFRDSEDELFMIGEKTRESKKDPVTGLLDAHAFVDQLIDYAAKYNVNDLDYGIIVMNNLSFDRIVQSYGNDFSNKVLKKIAECAVESAGGSCLIARPKNSIFAFITVVSDRDRFLETVRSLENNVNSITEVDGNKVTLRIKISSKIRSEEDVADETFYETALAEVIS